ncbi:MAG: TrkH family potassium uptake protein, partial [Planctomycetes bacterium]|nr:TrkH family potassium uptake protein [Planctomycetota bacterium]
MNYRIMVHSLGSLLVLLGVLMATAAVPSIGFEDGALLAVVGAAAATMAAGIVARRLSAPAPGDFSFREGFAIAALGWTVAGLFGALPYLFSGAIPGVIHACFESVSGFTTTGATILADIERLPPSLLYWRSLTQWLGGMGILVLVVAILPLLGVGGMQLFRAEVPGPVKDRLLPRIQDTAKLLWGVYILLTAAAAATLALLGMPAFEAICHALTCLSTGGFSPKNASLGHYRSAVQWVVVVFMFLGGVNFSLHYFALRGRAVRYLRSEEFLFYVLVLVVAAGVIAICNSGARDLGLADQLRHAVFQSVSICTTTGYGTDDFELWPTGSQVVLLTLMFIGGCSGSTAGGFKCVRVLLLIKHAYVQLFRLVHPHAVRHVKVDYKLVPQEVMQSILGLFALYAMAMFTATLILAAQGLDLVTAASSVITCLSNVGPGLGDVGP